MSDLLVVPLKKPSDVDVVQPLKNLIQSAYNASATEAAGSAPVDYTEIANEFGKLRKTAVWKFFEIYPTSLDIVYGYDDDDDDDE